MLLVTLTEHINVVVFVFDPAREGTVYLSVWCGTDDSVLVQSHQINVDFTTFMSVFLKK